LNALADARARMRTDAIAPALERDFLEALSATTPRRCRTCSRSSR
jgi:hypothetical protein